MASHRPRMQLDLSDRGGVGDFSDPSPVQSDSPKPNLTNLLLPISNRFSVGKKEGSSSKSSPKKAKDRFKRAPKNPPPVAAALAAVTEPLVGLNE